MEEIGKNLHRLEENKEEARRKKWIRLKERKREEDGRD